MDPFAPDPQQLIIGLALYTDGIDEAPDPAAELAARLDQAWEAQREGILHKLSMDREWQ